MIDLPTEFVTSKYCQFIFPLFADTFPTGFDNHHQRVLKQMEMLPLSPHREDKGGAQRNPNIGTS
jgi:hypothetical protein